MLILLLLPLLFYEAALNNQTLQKQVVPWHKQTTTVLLQRVFPKLYDAAVNNRNLKKKVVLLRKANNYRAAGYASTFSSLWVLPTLNYPFSRRKYQVPGTCGI